MKNAFKIVGLVLALGVIQPAFAGSVSFSVTDATDGTVSKTYTQFSDANITTWIAAYQSPCNVSINSLCTRPQVLNYIVSQVVANWVATTNAYNAQAAAASAATSAPTIAVAP